MKISFSTFFLCTGLYGFILGIINIITKNNITNEGLVYGGIANFLIGIILMIVLNYTISEESE